MNTTRRFVLTGGLAAAAMAGPALSAQPRVTGKIDAHAHFVPRFYLDALLAAGITRVDGGAVHPEWSAERHIEIMDRTGVRASLLSLAPPGVRFLSGDAASRMARAVNDAGAETCRRWPKRFGLLGVLPMLDTRAALDEIRHCFDELKVDGVGLATNYDGAYPGDRRFDAIFSELNRRSAVVFFHPTAPVAPETLSFGLPAPLLEYPFDTARAAVSLIYNDTPVRYPNLRFVFSHAGGALPVLATRIGSFSARSYVNPRPALGAAAVTSALANFYYELAPTAAKSVFEALRSIAPTSQIMYGTDYPYVDAAAVMAASDRFDELMLTLPDTDREAIVSGAALRLFPRLRAA